MSALDDLSDDEFASARPALSAIYAKNGWSWLLWGIVLIPIGFAVLAIAALTTEATSPWVAILLLAGVLLIGFPDGAEIINLGAAITMAAGLVPFGLDDSLDGRRLASIDLATTSYGAPTAPDAASQREALVQPGRRRGIPLLARRGHATALEPRRSAISALGGGGPEDP